MNPITISTSDLIQIIGIIISLISGIIAIVISVLTLRQNNKMIENSTRPYVVIYNDLVNGAGTPIQFLIIKNFGQTAAKINSIEILPKDIDFTYSKQLFSNMSDQIIAPGQSYSTAFKLSEACSDTVLSIKINYSTDRISYSETFSISQKAISDHIHSKVKSNDISHSLEIISGSFQDYLRSKL